VRRHGEVKGQEWGVSEIWGSADRVQPAGEQRLRGHAVLVSQVIRRVARGRWSRCSSPFCCERRARDSR
jgi:hypothetical protein